MRKWILIASLSLCGVGVAHAQQDDNAGDSEELNIIEVELESSEPKPEPVVQERPTQSPVQDLRPMDFSGLGQLAPFTEVSVIQKRYLPKTGRFQLFGGLTLITNDPFFNTAGFVGKAAYFFSENFGLELNYFGLSTFEAKATTELKKIQGVKTDNLIITNRVLALDLMWVPIYGKMSWFNERIVPFDLYFSLGGGQTNTGLEEAGTVHLATGQIFALSKSTAFRWDFSWNFFNTKGIDQKTAGYNNLFLTLGMSWFFPEAKYR